MANNQPSSLNTGVPLEDSHRAYFSCSPPVEASSQPAVHSAPAALSQAYHEERTVISSLDLDFAPPIQLKNPANEGYPASVTLSFSRVLGQTIGPTRNSRFHRAVVWHRGLHVLLSLSLFGGIAFIISVLVCVLASVAYLTYVARTSAPVVICALVCYICLCVMICRTLIRTAFRLLIWMWTKDSSTVFDDENEKTMDVHETLLRQRKLDKARPNAFKHVLLLLVFPIRLFRICVDGLVDPIVEALYQRKLNRRCSKQLKAQQIPTKIVAVTTLNQANGSVQADTTIESSRLNDVQDQNDCNEDTARTLTSGPAPLDWSRERHDLQDKVRHALYCVTMIVILLVPCLVIAFTFGYYSVVSYLSVSFVLFSAVFIILTNACARLQRTLKFLAMLWIQHEDLDPHRRRAMYVATAGYDGNLPVYDAVAQQLLKLSTLVFIIGALFTSMSDHLPFKLTTIAVIVVLMLFCLRNVLKCCFLPRKINLDADTCTTPYDGQRLNVVAVVYLSRVVLYSIGLCLLLLLDLSGTVSDSSAKEGVIRIIEHLGGDTTTSTSEIIALTVSFIGLFWIKETAFAITRLGGRTTCIATALSLVGLVTVAVIMNLKMIGFVSTSAAVLAYLAFDLRDGRAFWSHSANMKACKKYRSMRRSSINAMITVIVLLAAIVISISIGYLVGRTKSKGEAVASSQQLQFLNSTQQIPFCLRRYERFSLTDFITLAGASYAHSDDDAKAFANRNPRLKDAKVLYSNSNATGGVHVLEFQFEQTPNVSVVAIRGTATMGDAFQDMQLWSTSMILLGSSYFGTMTRLWPRRVVAEAVAIISGYVAFNANVYHQKVEEVVRDLQLKGRKVYLTGHSLGGGVASIVGARLGIPSVAVSAPGLGASYINFNVALPALTRWTMNIIPFSDPVPKVDIQAGEILHLPCTFQVPDECHRWRNTLQTMINTCNGRETSGDGIASVF